MEQTKIANKIDALFLAKVFVLASILVFAPLLKNQIITGPLVNFILFISVVLLGRNTALSLCVFPSIISLLTGFLSIIMAPVIPFVIVSNMILVLVFDRLRKNQYLAVLSSAMIKFLFLWGTSSFVVSMFTKPVAQKVSVMFSYPQFFTALAGGALAILVLKIINNNKKNDI